METIVRPTVHCHSGRNSHHNLAQQDDGQSGDLPGNPGDSIRIFPTFPTPFAVNCSQTVDRLAKGAVFAPA
ncbi:MAG: hypothetical protein ACK4RZ_17775 [Paracoccaceae bacterium]